MLGQCIRSYHMNETISIIQKIRISLKLTQSVIADAAGMDQSKFSRIEKGDTSSQSDMLKILNALVQLGSTEAQEYINFTKYEWSHIQPPSFNNPQRDALLQAENSLTEVQTFLEDADRPWPLKKQIENHKSSLLQFASYLTKTDHNIAVVGDIGVGKSTAISYLFDLLQPNIKSKSIHDNPILETGAGGTTICEVHIKGGPEFGLTINPMVHNDLKALIADFSSAKWNAIRASDKKSKSDTVTVSRESERAIRNMSKLVRKKTVNAEGKKTFLDPIIELALNASSEEDFRLQVTDLMSISERNKNELWYDSSTRQNPMEWLADTFKKINNGRMEECPLPTQINLLIPNFDLLSNELSLTVIDTKGVDDLAVREDLDIRLRDPRTATVFCCRFNDAPGTSAKALLQHIRETSSDKLEKGKVLILALPRDDEAKAMKDDIGERAETDEEGYDFKRVQLESEFAAEDMDNISVEFINVGSDDVATIRSKIIAQAYLLREGVVDKIQRTCHAASDIIDNHEAEALNAAVEEVTKQLTNFIRGTPSLSTRDRHAHQELIDTIKQVRYASTLWAATRRNGIYSGLNALHVIGIGSSKDAKKRADLWYSKLDSFLAGLEADKDLEIANEVISSIRIKVLQSKIEFTELARQIAVETYGEPLTQSHIWYECANEWGQGSGFKIRVIEHLQKWFDDQTNLQEALEASILEYFERSVIKPLQYFTDNK
jgi:transcriptional regulator with XRE-family HTH domain